MKKARDTDMHLSFLKLSRTATQKNLGLMIRRGVSLLLMLGVTAGCVTEALEDFPLATQGVTESTPGQTVTVPTETRLPSPTNTPPPTLRPTSENLPATLPDAVVKVASLEMYDGPAEANERTGSLSADLELKVTGQFYDCAWLKVLAPDGSEGWVKADPAKLEFNLGCSQVPLGSYRPVNGTILDDQRGDTADFLGELEVENGTADDGLVVITQIDGSAVIAFYVRAESSFTLTGIPDGDYWVYIASGQGWDETTHQMASVVDYERFEDTFPFETDASSYTIWSITLHPVPEGQADTEPVDPADFPKLGGI